MRAGIANLENKWSNTCKLARVQNNKRNTNEAGAFISFKAVGLADFW
jgi:hypothetical protein